MLRTARPARTSIWVAILCLLAPLLALATVLIPEADLEPFGAPCELSVAEAGGKRILSWSSVNRATTYRVGRIPCGGGVEGLAELDERSYEDADFDAGECYEYVVVAYDSDGVRVCSAHVENVGNCPCSGR